MYFSQGPDRYDRLALHKKVTTDFFKDQLNIFCLGPISTSKEVRSW